jgi:anti-sigma factor RsiW
MSAEVHCSQELLLQAGFDGELDAAQSAALEIHRANCSICAQALPELQRSRALLRNAPRFAAPQELRDKLQQQLQTKSGNEFVTRMRPESVGRKIRYLVSGAGVGAIAVGLFAFFLIGGPSLQTADFIVDNHVRAMQSPTHLLDVVSSEHHTVKPWFAGQIDFAPPVKDMEAFGYPLRGGRVDVIAGRSVAVMVYQAGKHSIDVSVAPRTGSTESTPDELRGFNIRRWSDADFNVWAVSDLNARELDAFVEHWKAAR